MRSVAATVAGLFVLSAFVMAIPVLLMSPTADAQGTPVKTDKVDVRGTAYVPPDIVVLKGTRVVWTNRDQVGHTVTNDDGAAETFDKPLAVAGLPAGTTADYTFTKVGVHKYHCRIHSTMHGSVKVVEKFEDPLVNVTVSDNLFSPDLVNLNVSQGIVWSGSGANLHSVTFENESVGDMGDVEVGKQVSVTFAEPGSFRYRCKYHSEDDFETGMVGKVLVGGSPRFPSQVLFTFPSNYTTVSGTVNITGTLKAGLGAPPVTAIEIDFDEEDNWSAADGIDSWTFPWDTTPLENGEHLIRARALVNETEESAKGVYVDVQNVEAPVEDGEKSTPGFEAILLGSASAIALGLLRRRNPR